jgi:hypothetical protein
MEDDQEVPSAVSSFWDPDSGPLPLSASSGPPVSEVHTPTPPKTEAKQLSDRILAVLVPLQQEISHIASIVDGTATTKRVPQGRGPLLTSHTHKDRTPPAGLAPSTHRTSLGSTPQASAPTPPAARIDDDDAEFPKLGSYHGPPLDPSTGWKSSTPRAPAQGDSNSRPRGPRIGMSFASVVTVEALGQREKAAGHARLVRQVQKSNPSGKFKPGHSAVPQGYTDVVIIHEGGSNNRDIEAAFRRHLPVDITQAAQRALNTLVWSPPIILWGRWSETVEKTGNFVFHFAGSLSPQIIASYQTSLCSHFLVAERACIVPTTGWTWVQFRGVDVARLGEYDTEIIYSGDELLSTLRANPCFNETIFSVRPHWQGNMANFRGQTAMVIAAILDADNAACQRASSEGVCMFGRRVKFVQAGDSPSLVQCSRCHEIGHYYTSPKCRWTSSRCYRCGRNHDVHDHDFECKGVHKVVGVCDCVPKCILCKGSGHHAHEKACLARGDFVPPRLPRAAPAEALPAVEDALKSDAIPFLRPRVRPARKGRGGGKER